MVNVDGYYLLTDIGMLAKHEDSVSYLYRRGKGWEPDVLLGEYIYLGNLDFERITEAKAEELAKRFDAGEVLS